MVTEAQVLDALRNIVDPDLHKDVVSLGFIKNMKIESGAVSFDFELTTPACPVKDRFLDQAQRLVGAIPGVARVSCTMTSNVRPAVALQQSGARVGLLDADIHGPNVPLMMGLSEPPHQHENRIVPGLSHGVKIMSAGYFVQENMPLIWRGPMVGKMIQELLGNVEWGELDYLVVDLPPGTGHAPLTLAQSIPLSGAVVVTQPPDVSLMDATKAI